MVENVFGLLVFDARVFGTRAFFHTLFMRV